MGCEKNIRKLCDRYRVNIQANRSYIERLGTELAYLPASQDEVYRQDILTDECSW